MAVIWRRRVTFRCARPGSIRSRSAVPSGLWTERRSSGAPHCARDTWIAPIGRALSTSRRSRSPRWCASRCNGRSTAATLRRRSAGSGLVRRHGAGSERCLGWEAGAHRARRWRRRRSDPAPGAWAPSSCRPTHFSLAAWVRNVMARHTFFRAAFPAGGGRAAGVRLGWAAEPLSEHHARGPAPGRSRRSDHSRTGRRTLHAGISLRRVRGNGERDDLRRKLADLAVLSQAIFTMPVDAPPVIESVLLRWGARSCMMPRY